jgi:uncharacterized membrane protein YkvI
MMSQWLSRSLLMALLVVTSMTVAGCEVIGDIFQAGVWVGGLLVVIIVVAVGFVAAKMRS